MKVLGKTKEYSHKTDILIKDIEGMYHNFIDEASRKYPNVPRGMIVALIKMESGGRPGIISPKGAIGLLQLMPGTAKDLKVNPFDPQQNIEGGTHYMSQLLQRYHGNIDMALAAYNHGMGRIDRNGLSKLPAETSNYIEQYHNITGK